MISYTPRHSFLAALRKASLSVICCLICNLEGSERGASWTWSCKYFKHLLGTSGAAVLRAIYRLLFWSRRVPSQKTTAESGSLSLTVILCDPSDQANTRMVCTYSSTHQIRTRNAKQCSFIFNISISLRFSQRTKHHVYWSIIWEEWFLNGWKMVCSTISEWDYHCNFNLVLWDCFHLSFL